MDYWAPGFTDAQLDAAQERYDLRFPPDLVALLRDRRPIGGYAWDHEDAVIRRMLAWPLEMLVCDVERGFWWPDWGDRPTIAVERQEVVRDALGKQPRLIPLLGHRFLPESPCEAGNPVFSMHGFDTIYYGATLAEYFVNEFDGHGGIGKVRRIPFWSDVAENHDIAYAYYAAAAEQAGGFEALRKALARDRGDDEGGRQ